MTLLPARVPLAGADWQFKGYYGEDWLWRNAHKPDTRDVRHWHPAVVPGSVIHDLWQHGLVPNPYFELNSQQCEWAADRTWLYKKAFSIDAALRGRRARLCFEGVDYEARFFLNGQLLGQHAGMFTPVTFEVGGLLNYESGNLIAVVIEPAPAEQAQVGYTSRVRTLKARMNYWWDFCPRLVHQGLWQDVYLDFTGPVRIDDVFAHPEVAPPWREAVIHVQATLEAAEPSAAEVTMALRLGERQLGTHRSHHALQAGQTRMTADFHIDAPGLWWPNGHGQQPLYSIDVQVTPGPREAESTVSDARSVDFGIRRLEFVPNSPAPSSARPYTAVVNGQRIYLKGWNWVPLDVLYGVPRPAKLDHLLRLAQRANVNLLRVWGGGLIETEAFYSRCDRLGLLVWQEFNQSSSGIDNAPPTDPDFIAWLVSEAGHIVRRRRNHPALAIWCGGNELQSGPDRPEDDNHPLLRALKDVVQALDPGRHWLPTSPSGPVFSNCLENIAADPDSLHDVHGPWEHQGVIDHFRLYNAGTSLMHSEFGVEGLSNRSALDAVMRREKQWPVTLDSPLWFHLGAWWIKAPRWREVFGEVTDLAALHRGVQFLQADGLRYAVEANRRRKYQNSASLPWQFNEPYPMAACTSAVDYFGWPKPAYYAVAAAYAPVHVSARFDRQAWAGQRQFSAEIWVSHSLEDDLPEAEISASLLGWSGQRYHEAHARGSAAPNAASRLLSVAWDLTPVSEPVFLLDLALTTADGQRSARNRYLFSREADLAPLLSPPPAEVLAEAARPSGGAVAVTNLGPASALFVWLEPDRPVTAPGYGYFSDNYFCLLPGERREISVTWEGVPPAEQRLIAGGWNTNVVRVSL